MEVDLRGGAVPEIDGGDAVLAPQPAHIRVADGVGELAGDGDGDDPLAVAGQVPVAVG